LNAAKSAAASTDARLYAGIKRQTDDMTFRGKLHSACMFLAGLAGAVAHDILGFSKVVVVGSFVIIGIGLVLSLYFSGHKPNNS
jgi:hypothetical protein